jgi:hypothetical protein
VLPDKANLPFNASLVSDSVQGQMPRQCIESSDRATVGPLGNGGLFPGFDRDNFSTGARPFWGQCIPLSSEYRGSFPGSKAATA